MNIAIVYATEHGSTTEIAVFMQNYLIEHGHDVDVYDAKASLPPTFGACDVVLLGAPIYKGLWHKDMLRFIARHHVILEDKTLFAWLTCIRIVEPDSLKHIQDHYIPGDLNAFHVQNPIGIFAGKLALDLLPEDEHWAFHVRYDGHTRMQDLGGDFRDWDAIQQWLEDIAGKIQKLSTRSIL